MIRILFFVSSLFISSLSFADDLPETLASQLGQKIDLIAIDPGFGGKEGGSSGCGVWSKDINLQIAKELSKRITKDLSINTILTRENDEYIPLEARSAFANTNAADLFISIQTNGSDLPTVSGVEIFYMNLPTDSNSIVSDDTIKMKKLVSTLDPSKAKKSLLLGEILSVLMQNTKMEDSKLLAKMVQKHLFLHLNKRYKSVRNRGLKTEPFFVLLASHMPAIMIEVGFITNPGECQLLVSKKYQKELVLGIMKGVKSFITMK